ncbi:MAG: hypothetical protein HY092_01765 [Candidatus Kerfeldbacteria bacterium]|nr:hypothetical protein [Candidatus Kerfeldbacteria bacterium]
MDTVSKNQASPDSLDEALATEATKEDRVYRAISVFYSAATAVIVVLVVGGLVFKFLWRH